MVFNFRIMEVEEGVEVVNRELKTPEEALTPVELVNYQEWENRLLFMDRMRQKEIREVERKRKLEHNPFYKVVCACGLL